MQGLLPNFNASAHSFSEYTFCCCLLFCVLSSDSLPRSPSPSCSRVLLSSHALIASFCTSLYCLDPLTAFAEAQFPRFLQVAVTFRQHNLNQNLSGLSWINNTRGSSINIGIHKELMGSGEWHENATVIGGCRCFVWTSVFVCLLLVATAVEREPQCVSIVSTSCCPAKQRITRSD